MKNLIYILVAGLALAACSKGRIIPDNKLEDIYYDMFLADQWLILNPSKDGKADTTFFYEPVFRAHGYTFKDYDRTVQEKLKDPEGFSKLLKRVSDKLSDKAEMIKDVESQNEKVRLALLKAPYFHQDFGFPMFSRDGDYINYYERLNIKQYGFSEKIQLFSK